MAARTCCFDGCDYNKPCGGCDGDPSPHPRSSALCSAVAEPVRWAAVSAGSVVDTFLKLGASSKRSLHCCTHHLRLATKAADAAACIGRGAANDEHVAALESLVPIARAFRDGVANLGVAAPLVRLASGALGGVCGVPGAGAGVGTGSDSNGHTVAAPVPPTDPVPMRLSAALQALRWLAREPRVQSAAVAARLPLQLLALLERRLADDATAHASSLVLWNFCNHRDTEALLLPAQGVLRVLDVLLAVLQLPPTPLSRGTASHVAGAVWALAAGAPEWDHVVALQVKPHHLKAALAAAACSTCGRFRTAVVGALARMLRSDTVLKATLGLDLDRDVQAMAAGPSDTRLRSLCASALALLRGAEPCT